MLRHHRAPHRLPPIDAVDDAAALPTAYNSFGTIRTYALPTGRSQEDVNERKKHTASSGVASFHWNGSRRRDQGAHVRANEIICEKRKRPDRRLPPSGASVLVPETLIAGSAKKLRKASVRICTPARHTYLLMHPQCPRAFPATKSFLDCPEDGSRLERVTQACSSRSFSNLNRFRAVHRTGGGCGSPPA